VKVLGRTLEGGNIIELSPQEVSLLIELQDAIEGASWIPGPPRQYPADGNLDRIFLAIIHFVNTKFAINSLKILVDELNEKVTGEK